MTTTSTSMPSSAAERGRPPATAPDAAPGTAPESVVRVAARDAVLLVVDVQNDFCHPAGTMGVAGRDLTAVHRAVDRIGVLLDAARSAGVPVVFVRTEHGPDLDSPGWLHRHAPGIGPEYTPAPPNCPRGTWGAGFYRVAPRPDEWVTVKHRYSAFTTPGFASRLAAYRRRSLLFCGVTTDVCVESSLRSAVDHDYLATVVEDACAAYTEADHAAAVAVVARGFGQAVTTDTLVARWRNTSTERVMT